MPSKKPLIQAYVTPELKSKFAATAKQNNRSESNMLIEVLEFYYKAKEALPLEINFGKLTDEQMAEFEAAFKSSRETGRFYIPINKTIDVNPT